MTKIYQHDFNGSLVKLEILSTYLYKVVRNRPIGRLFDMVHVQEDEEAHETPLMMGEPRDYMNAGVKCKVEFFVARPPPSFAQARKGCAIFFSRHPSSDPPQMER